MFALLSLSRNGLSTSCAHKAKKASKTTGKQLPPRINPFNKDKGAARQLQLLDVHKDDIVFSPELLGPDVDFSVLRDESKNFRKQYKADWAQEKLVARRKMIEKRVFPKPINPVLLTWQEKETIRYLHKKDPVAWSLDRLSESFPADPATLKKVVHSRGTKSPNIIGQLEKAVRENWKLLAKGKLEVSPALEKHLKTFPQRNLELSDAEILEMQEKIREENRIENRPRLLVQDGEFSKIINDYEAKIAAKSTIDSQDKFGVNSSDQVTEMSNLFGENTIPGNPLPYQSSPYGESSLLQTDIDLSREPNMDIERFRDMYLKRVSGGLSGRDKHAKHNAKTIIPQALQKSDSDENSPSNAVKAYYQWLEEQEEKSKLANKSVAKINLEDIEWDNHDDAHIEKGLKEKEGINNPKKFKDKDSKNEPENLAKLAERFGLMAKSELSNSSQNEDDISIGIGTNEISGQEELYVFNPESGYEKLKLSSPDKIEIPDHLLAQGYIFFQVGDTVYDSDGEFLYRVTDSLQK